jgi:hypothetical protein
MSAIGTKQTFRPMPFYVRFRGQSGHSHGVRFMSAYDPKRTFSAANLYRVSSDERGRIDTRP